MQDYQNIIHNIIDLLETDIDDIEFMLEILACSDVDMSYKKQKYISEILDNRLQDLI